MDGLIINHFLKTKEKISFRYLEQMFYNNRAHINPHHEMVHVMYVTECRKKLNKHMKNEYVYVCVCVNYQHN